MRSRTPGFEYRLTQPAVDAHLAGFPLDADLVCVLGSPAEAAARGTCGKELAYRGGSSNLKGGIMELRPRVGAGAGLLGAALVLALLAFAAPAQAHVAFCEETVNPHGKTVPPAGSSTLPGSKGGINEDGFYRVGTEEGTDVRLEDTDGNVFGVFPSGTKVKYTEANGAEPSVKKIGSDNGQAGAVDFHITGTGDLVVVPVDGGTRTTCPVPPPPK
jgi:hypothetical protein